jgi:hypothetical protein
LIEYTSNNPTITPNTADAPINARNAAFAASFLPLTPDGSRNGNNRTARQRADRGLSAPVGSSRFEFLSVGMAPQTYHAPFS